MANIEAMRPLVVGLAVAGLLTACGSSHGDVVNDGATVDGSSSAGSDSGSLSDGAGSGGGVSDGSGATTLADGSGATTLADGSGATTLADGKTVGVGSIADAGGGDPVDKAKKYQLCSKLIECAQSLCTIEPGPKCYETCTNAASKSANSCLEPFRSCVFDDCVPKTCANKVTTACLGTCNEKCGALALICMADGKSGDKSCSDNLACNQACDDIKAKGQDDFACRVGCYQAASPAAQKQLNEFYQCIFDGSDGNGGEGCMAKMLTCAADGSNGKLKCANVLSCIGKCPGSFDNASCLGTCYGKGTKLAQGQVAAMMTCYGEADKDPSKKGTCYDELLNCSEPTGTSGCQDGFGCFGTCAGGGGDPFGCMVKCIGEMSPVEAKKFIDVMACGEKCEGECTDNPTGSPSAEACKKECEQAKCTDVQKACLG